MSSSKLQTGSAFPAGVKFRHAPSPADTDSQVCLRPIDIDVSAEFTGKKVIVVSVPGAFTPTCHMSHLPGYLQNVSKLSEKGVDEIVVIASNDAWVMDGWGKGLLKGVESSIPIRFMEDIGSAFSKQYATTAGPDRNGRYALLIDNGKVVFAGYDAGDLQDSSFETLASHL